MRNLLVLIFMVGFTGCTSKTTIPTSCTDIKSCKAVLASKLQSNLTLYESYRGHFVTIKYSLDDNANVIEHKISSSTGLIQLEEAIVKAVYDSSPYTAFLSLSKQDFEEVRDIILTYEPYG